MAEIVTPQDLQQHLVGRGESPALMAVQGESLETLSAAGLADKSASLAAGLLHRGVAPGDVIALYGPNSLAWAVARLGIALTGGLAAAFDDLLPENEAAQLIRHSGCRMLFTTEAHASRLRAELGDEAPDFLLLDREGEPAIGSGWRSLLEKSSGALPDLSPETPAMIVYTSGTTGQPKSFVLTYGNLAGNVNALAKTGLIGPTDRALLPLPLDNVYPYVVGLLAILAAGGSVVMPDEISGPGMSRALRLSNATAMIGVPRLYNALLSGIRSRVAARGRLPAWLFERLLSLSIALCRHTGRRFGKTLFSALHAQFGPNLRLLVCGGAKLEGDLVWSLEGLGWDVRGGYGLAEVGSVFTGNTPGQKKIGSEGKPINAGEVRVAEADEQGIGEIQLKGPSVFSGYRDNPEANRTAFTDDGWFRTGDLGRQDDEGFLYITGRAKEMIVLGGGKNVFPEELERIYAESPYVAEIAVLEEQGSLVGLVMPDLTAVRESGYARIEDALRVSLTEIGRDLPRFQRLAGFAIVRESLPRTRLGKYRRFLLPQIYREARRGVTRQKAGLSEEDRAYLADPTAKSVWEILRGRYPDRPFGLESNLQLDLGIDSLESMNLAADLEARLGITLPDQTWGEIDSVRSLIDAVSEAQSAGQVRPQPSSAAETEVWQRPPGPLLRGLGIALHAFNWLLMRLLFRLRRTGLENLPRSGPCLLVANHASDLDPLALAGALPPHLRHRVHWGGDAVRLFSSPFSANLARSLHVFPVDEKSPGASLERARAILDRDAVLAWFPESWRSPDGRLQNFLPGVGRLVAGFSGPVIPVYIEGSFAALPRWRRLPRLHSLRVRFGPAVSLAERDAGSREQQDAAATARRLRQEVAKLSPLPEDQEAPP